MNVVDVRFTRVKLGRVALNHSQIHFSFDSCGTVLSLKPNSSLLEKLNAIHQFPHKSDNGNKCQAVQISSEFLD